MELDAKGFRTNLVMVAILCVVASVTSVGLWIFPALILGFSLYLRVRTVNAIHRAWRELEGPGLLR